jgi:histidinol-phosphate phosphatase family protein
VEIMMQTKRAAFFFDRDGTVIVDVGYPRDPDQVQLLDGVGLALRQLQQKQFALILVSNQSGIGRGIITCAEAQRVHERTVACLASEAVHLDAACYCPHAPEDGCTCRKPSPEMLLRAARQFDIDLTRSFMAGDRSTDIEAGKRAGCRTIQLAQPRSLHADLTHADLIARDWQSVVRYVLDHPG